MAKKQNDYWYVLVMTMYGAVFVTDIKVGTRDAEFDKNKKPKSFNKEDAQYLALGLTWNGHLGFPVCSQWEIDNQPFRYDLGEFEWKDFNSVCIGCKYYDRCGSNDRKELCEGKEVKNED